MKREHLHQVWKMTKYISFGIFLQALLGGLLSAEPGIAQKSVDEIYVYHQHSNKTVQAVFKEIESQTDFFFTYREHEVLSKKYHLLSGKISLGELLRDISVQHKVHFKRINNNISVNDRQKTEEVPIVEVMAEEEIMVSGKVTDKANVPLPGVNILLKGTSKGTTTNAEGGFQLKVPEGAVLVFSFIGYQNQEVAIGAQTRLNVVMEEEYEQLEEVVVTALGVKRETKALGYSVTEVNAETMTKAPALNSINSLAGKVAGVDISAPNTGPGGSSRVVIRGNSSLSPNSQPLYVIDGMPVDNQTPGQAGDYGGLDLGDGISSLNPDDIATMSVLKGPAAAALYGTRAQHGVILITTKQGKARKGIGVEFNSNVVFDVMGAQFKDVQKVYGQGSTEDPLPDTQDRATRYGSWGAKLDPSVMVFRFDGEMVDYGDKNSTIRDFFRTGHTLSNTLTLSGGNEQSTFRFSMTDLRNEDIVPNSGLERKTFTLRGTTKLGKKMTVDAKVTYQNEKVNNRPFLGNTDENAALVLTRLPANVDINWLKDLRLNEDGTYRNWNNSSERVNPFYIINEMSNKTVKDRIMGFAEFNYAMTDWLNLRLKAGLDQYSFYHQSKAPRTTPNRVNGTMEEIHMKASEFNGEFLLTAKKQFSEDWFASASVGGNLMKSQTERTDIVASNEITGNLSSINNYTVFSTLFSQPRKQINSLYAFGNLSYRNFLFLDVTARNDWSSTLPTANNSYFYPSVAASFVFTDAWDFTGNLLSFGKIRASYAEVGGDTDPYNLDLSYSLRPYAFGGRQMVAANLDRIPNKELLPSRTKGFEVGLDLRFLKGRVNLDMTYYNQMTHDEIIALPVALSSGSSYLIVNAGKVSNKGIELLLTTNLVQSKNIDWELSFNFAKNTNKVVKLLEGVKTHELSRATWVSAYIQANEGERYGQIVGFDFRRDEQGNIIYATSGENKGLPLRSGEPVVLGNGVYDWTGGIGNTLRYKNFGLKALIDVKMGADVLSMTNMALYFTGVHMHTLEGREDGYIGKGVKPVVGGDGTVSYVPNDQRVTSHKYFTSLQNNDILTPFIYDASYVKLRELALSYSVPNQSLEKSFIRGLSFALVARNLWTIYSNLPNVDPESSYNNGNGQGFEYGSLPTRISYGFNINAKF
ncbi:SusC/RagA family TonB-linked outer membrane protein [Rapidithrix thailandica]|uniref:SusC/RagA family TonB-linked outer membrane protein n=1 Tax=Rapidithrix thailandica TaxID=413964 RepID=A0AAW9S4I0_9BACT